jgi:hypothetical protein
MVADKEPGKQPGSLCFPDPGKQPLLNIYTDCGRVSIKTRRRGLLPSGDRDRRYPNPYPQRPDKMIKVG